MPRTLDNPGETKLPIIVRVGLCGHHRCGHHGQRKPAPAALKRAARKVERRVSRRGGR